MPPLRFDLQSHSTHSDGALEAAEVVERAARAGVELLALSDHDTVSGVAEALRAGERYGVRVVPAVEISAIDADAEEGGIGTPRELHILGYNIDHTGPVLTARLAEFLADREQRTLRMAAALEELGFELDETQIEARVAAGKPIGRPHLAEAVLAAPANAARLKDEQIDDIGSLIRGYLIEGKPGLPPARDSHRGRRRSRRSTRPAAWRSGRTRSGTSPTPRRCSRRSIASECSGSTGSRPST